MTASRDIARLYDEHAPALFAFLLNLTRDEADTKDCLQEVFVRLAGAPGALAGARDERAFLLRCARNLAVDRIRRQAARRRHRQRFGEERLCLFAPAADPDEAAFRTELDAALADLPPEQREVVHLKLWEGLTFEAIAGLLDVPLNTAASRYRYGMDKLRARLRPLYDEIR